MTEKLIDILKQLQQENPKLLEGLENAAAAGLQADKIALYEIFIKGNIKKDKNSFDYEALDNLLARHENSRLDINWNKGEYIYRIVVSRRKREPEKPRKPKEVKPDESNSAVAQEQNTGT